jgi:hypothetical protein
VAYSGPTVIIIEEGGWVEYKGSTTGDDLHFIIHDTDTLNSMTRVSFNVLAMIGTISVIGQGRVDANGVSSVNQKLLGNIYTPFVDTGRPYLDLGNLVQYTVRQLADRPTLTRLASLASGIRCNDRTRRNIDPDPLKFPLITTVHF